jgi:hypothetical protein
MKELETKICTIIKLNTLIHKEKQALLQDFSCLLSVIIQLGNVLENVFYISIINGTSKNNSLPFIFVNTYQD